MNKQVTHSSQLHQIKPARIDVKQNEDLTIINNRIDLQPPIIIHTTDYASLKELLISSGILSTPQATKKELYRLQLNSYREYVTASVALLRNNYEFYSYHRKKDKVEKFVIRGFPHVEKDYLVNAIHKLGYKPKHITELKVSEKNKYFLPLYLVYFGPKQREQSQMFQTVKIIDQVQIRIERYQGRPGPQQCFRCQKWGHSSAFCKNRQRCVICAGEHDSKSCLLDKTESASCANCGGEHTASYRGCKIYKAVAINSPQRKIKKANKKYQQYQLRKH